MYFLDDHYYYPISTGELFSFIPDYWYSHYDFGNYIYTNNPDGAFGVYYSPSGFSGNTSDIQNFTSQINETSCKAISNQFIDYKETILQELIDGFDTMEAYTGATYTGRRDGYTFKWTNLMTIYEQFPSVYWDGNKCRTKADPLAHNCCGNEGAIGFDTLMTQPLSAVTTIEDFDYFLTSELIDAKNRKTLSGYPTLRALYDRYMNSEAYCPTTSSKFDYTKMDQFAGLIDNYWVDIVEQVVPATTIWGSVKVYSNTLFDQQKFKYKSYSSLFCENQFEGTSVLSPINGTTGECVNVEVIITPLNVQTDPNVRVKNKTTICNSICIAQMNSGSEFVGTVKVVRIRIGGGIKNETTYASEGIGLGHGSYTVIENLAAPTKP
jgi:hypothetical protein